MDDAQCQEGAAAEGMKRRDLRVVSMGGGFMNYDLGFLICWRLSGYTVDWLHGYRGGQLDHFIEH
jgi:hypothetical protein